uniref:F-box domain-containing protein n=1 Tax=Strongyloides venezuelensis TaxID=75913 RepID=A0A0K0EVX2_STRVS
MWLENKRVKEVLSTQSASGVIYEDLAKIPLNKFQTTVMEKKDSINKLNYQIVTVKEKKLTPAQVIANNTEILSLIFGNIVDFKERKNVELSCRKFYEVCNHRTIRSYFPFEEMNYSHFCTRHDEGNLRIDMYGQEMTINIPKEFSFNEINMDIFTKVFRKCLSKVNSLNIQNISLHHVDFFMSLNCFKKIENVNMEYETLVNGGDIIFSKCSTLNPVNLTISNVFLIEENIKNVGQYTLPESIKTIHLSSMSFEWLLKKMGSIKIGIFDNLIYNESLSCLMNEKNKLELYLKLITYFKNISYEVYNFETIPNNEIFNKILLKNNIASFVTITFNDNNIYERFSRLSKDERSREAEGYIQNLKNPTRRFLAQPGIHLNIKKLKILDIHEKRINCPFFPLEIKK